MSSEPLPIATFSLPVVFDLSASIPIATLLVPVVFDLSASNQNAILLAIFPPPLPIVAPCTSASFQRLMTPVVLLNVMFALPHSTPQSLNCT